MFASAMLHHSWWLKARGLICGGKWKTEGEHEIRQNRALYIGILTKWDLMKFEVVLKKIHPYLKA